MAQKLVHAICFAPSDVNPRYKVTCVALLMTLLSGCSSNKDECQFGEFRCDESKATECRHLENGNGTYAAWVRTACVFGTCQTDQNGAFCALDGGPEPRCAASDSVLFCDGSTVLQCRGIYLISTYNCATEVSLTGAYGSNGSAVMGNEYPTGPNCTSELGEVACR